MKHNDFEIECIDARWIEPAAADGAWTLSTLEQISGLAASELRELIDYGALQPQNADLVAEEHWLFAARCAVTVRTAVRLRRDFDLDAPALALALTLVDRIRDLEDELRRAHALMPRE